MFYHYFCNSFSPHKKYNIENIHTQRNTQQQQNFVRLRYIFYTFLSLQNSLKLLLYFQSFSILLIFILLAILYPICIIISIFYIRLSINLQITWRLLIFVSLVELMFELCSFKITKIIHLDSLSIRWGLYISANFNFKASV